MKNTLLVLICLIVVGGCGSPEDKIIIEEIEGVTHLYNPEKGLWADRDITIQLDTILQIGALEGTIEESFSRIRDVAVDSKGYIYIYIGWQGPRSP